MVNPWAGEAALTLDGRVHVLKLTLGALAELEAQLHAEGLIDLIERFEAGKYRSRDLIALLCAGLRGAAGAARCVIWPARISKAAPLRPLRWPRVF